jgi:hypothetical protein
MAAVVTLQSSKRNKTTRGVWWLDMSKKKEIKNDKINIKEIKFEK